MHIINQSIVLDDRGTSVIVGEIMLIAIVTIIMSGIAVTVIRSHIGERPVYADLRVRVENTPDVRTVMITIRHFGGSSIEHAGDALRIGATLENYEALEFAWVENITLPNPNTLSFTDNLVCYATFNNVVSVGNNVTISITVDYEGLYESRWLYRRTVPVIGTGQFYSYLGWYYGGP
jgi:FlaG/FlaF family flagellin (archaellin)